MGRVCLVQLDGRFYSCHSCHTHLANFDDLMSKSFHCRHGKAYLFNTVFYRDVLQRKTTHAVFRLADCERAETGDETGCVNVSEGPLEERMMTTGLHTVSDIYCKGCQRIVGWKYEAAQQKAQKYKEGKFILERVKVESSENNEYYLETQASDPDDV